MLKIKNYSKSIYYLLFLPLILVPIIFSESFNWSYNAPKYLVFHILVSFLLILFSQKSISLKINKIDIFVTIFIIYIIINSIFKGGGLLLRRVDTLLFIILFYYLLQLDFVGEKKNVHIFLKYFIIIHCILLGVLSIYGILQFFNIDIYNAPMIIKESKVVATFGNPNNFAGYISAAFPYLLFSLRNNSYKYIKCILMILTVVVISALILTISRGAWIALILGCILLYFDKIKQYLINPLNNKYINYIIFCVLIVFSVFMFKYLYEINPDSAKGRLLIWSISKNMILGNWIFGIGFGRFGVEYLDYQADFFKSCNNIDWYGWASNLQGAKNEFIQIFVELGIVGLFLFLIILVMFIKLYRIKIIQNKLKDYRTTIYPYMIVSIIIVLIHGLIDNPFDVLPISLLFIFNIGMLSNLSKTENKNVIIVNINNNWIIKIFITMLFLLVSFHTIQQARGFFYWRKGQEYVISGKWIQGINEYQKALKYLPNNGELKYYLGAAYSYTDQPQMAINLLTTSLRNYNDKNIYITRGYAYSKLKMYEMAKKDLFVALNMYPQLLLPRLWIAKILINQKDFNGAIYELKIIINSNPKIINDEVLKIKFEAQNLLQHLTS